jgi:hypothetical protein
MSDETDTGINQLQFLIGTWKGQGEGFGHKSEVEQTFQYMFDERFIQSKTRSIARDENGTVIEIHEDLEIFSYDNSREKVILRGFYSEGYVNEYVMEPGTEGENQLIFTSVKTENAGGMLARQRMEIISENEFTFTLDLAKKGEEFKPCQVIKMKRVS